MSEIAKPLSPKVSIIVPCRNEIAFIDRCLSSVFQFEGIDENVEVLVIDGLSDDGTKERLAEWKQINPSILILDNPGKIVPTAMNIGIKAARGQILLRLDAHSEYPPNYLRLCVDTSNRTQAENVGGIIITELGTNTREARLVQALTTHSFGVGNSNFRIGGQEGRTDTVPFGCYRRQVFDEVGYYDERLVRNQDYELNRRIIRGGGLIWCNPAIQIRYYNQKRIGGLLKQAYITASWNPWMWYVAPYSFQPRHSVPGIFIMALLVFSLLGTKFKVARGLVGIILLPYTVISLFASYQQSRRFGLWTWPLLPILFFIYHFAYGIGILRGVLELILGSSPVQKTLKSRP